MPGWALWLFFAFSNFLENVFPPWPGDSFTAFSGFLAAQTHPAISLFSVITASLTGNWLGAFLMFRFGARVLQFLKKTKLPFLKALYEEESLEKTFHWFRRNSILVVILSRFSAGIRFFVSIVAGMAKMNIIQFMFLYTVAIVLWCGLLIGGGFKLGKNWNQILVILSVYNKIITIAIVFFAVVFCIFYYLKKRRTKLTP
ncbi:DedA family protein [Leptospira idonii]|uniref:DedA family protein n=2 Tax=Leptospira idonii TaxID=1193500 RepID=A0A4R9M243_9LEPT|nr:DedA family protein [Leptospira idonii]